MDEFGLFVFGAFVVVLAIFLAIGKWYPGSGAEQVDWRPTRSPELEAQLELDDVDQMIEAQNARRRATGRPEITEDGIRDDVARAERHRRNEAERYRDTTGRPRGLTAGAVLIVGCGCRGRELGRDLAAGPTPCAAPRATRGQLAAIEADGLEAVQADPDRLGTLRRPAGGRDRGVLADGHRHRRADAVRRCTATGWSPCWARWWTAARAGRSTRRPAPSTPRAGRRRAAASGGRRAQPDAGRGGGRRPRRRALLAAARRRSTAIDSMLT